MLSVVIPTRNRAGFLKSALQSLMLQTLPRNSFEVLVIDNGSTDDTKQVVASAQQQLFNVRYFYDARPGLHIGRHLGMKKATSDILVYADDDVEAFPTWLEAIDEGFKISPDVALVGGKILPKFKAPAPSWMMRMWSENRHRQRVMGYLSLLDMGNSILQIDPSYVFGCNFSVRKSILEETQGFHPDAMPDGLVRFRGDGESYVSRFIGKKGYKTIYHPKASVFHVLPAERLTEAYICRRSYHQGISDSYSCLRKGLRPPRYFMGRLMNWLKSPGCRWSIYFDARQYRITNSYRQGFFMHQREAYRDKSLYQWIMKEHYHDG